MAGLKQQLKCRYICVIHYWDLNSPFFYLNNKQLLHLNILLCSMKICKSNG